ncbi:DUF4811 domain-containing protein [Lactobacillus sp. CBA3606]|uniref:DUF4811 domain-containing protein n=1 Tax=Lactobacillus sp. CBA3606 TaxID=2099789 RepID=UPI000CFA9C09|nr:DUF4811 domain-containing protein [Lactobacillus sp. CBA3606]AVK63658.1 DUF4811 domain-containing protein [Lactobacillus sp. CBA3606]
MIIIGLILFVFIFSGLMIFRPNSLGRTIGITLSFLIIAGSLIALILNDNYHWGMVKVKTTQTVTLKPLRTKRLAVGIHQLGHGSERVLVYRTTLKPNQIQTTTTNATTTLTTGATPHVQIATTRWQYRNAWTRHLFELGKSKQPLASKQYTFNLPTNWHSFTLTNTK